MGHREPCGLVRDTRFERKARLLLSLAFSLRNSESPGGSLALLDAHS